MAVVTERGADDEREWNERFAAWTAAHPDAREAWDRDADGAAARRLGRRAADVRGRDATSRRAIAGRPVMNAIRTFTPTMIGGAADLVESTKTEIEGGGVFSATHAGRNVAFGIREHAMGSIVNGIALVPGMVQAVRLDVPHLLRLHAPRRPAVRR